MTASKVWSAVSKTVSHRQNTTDDVETLALSSQRLPPIAVRLDALGRTFHPPRCVYGRLLAGERVTN